MLSQIRIKLQQKHLFSMVHLFGRWNKTSTTKLLNCGFLKKKKVPTKNVKRCWQVLRWEFYGWLEAVEEFSREIKGGGGKRIVSRVVSKHKHMCVCVCLWVWRWIQELQKSYANLVCLRKWSSSSAGACLFLGGEMGWKIVWKIS